MKQELDNSPEEFLRNIAEELTNISGECTEIKQAQLTAATTDDLNNMGTSIASAVIEKVNTMKSAIDSQSQTVSEIGDNLTTSVNSLTTAVTEKIDNTKWTVRRSMLPLRKWGREVTCRQRNRV